MFDNLVIVKIFSFIQDWKTTLNFLLTCKRICRAICQPDCYKLKEKYHPIPKEIRKARMPCLDINLLRGKIIRFTDQNFEIIRMIQKDLGIPDKNACLVVGHYNNLAHEWGENKAYIGCNIADPENGAFVGSFSRPSSPIWSAMFNHCESIDNSLLVYHGPCHSFTLDYKRFLMNISHTTFFYGPDGMPGIKLCTNFEIKTMQSKGKKFVVIADTTKSTRYYYKTVF